MISKSLEMISKSLGFLQDLVNQQLSTFISVRKHTIYSDLRLTSDLQEEKKLTSFPEEWEE